MSKEKWLSEIRNTWNSAQGIIASRAEHSEALTEELAIMSQRMESALNHLQSDHEQVVIHVRGGIASTDICTDGVDLEIIDLDDLDDCCMGHIVVQPSQTTMDVYKSVKGMLAGHNGHMLNVGYEGEDAVEFIQNLPNFMHGVYVSQVKLPRSSIAFVLSDQELEEAKAIAYVESKGLMPLAKHPYADILGLIKIAPEKTFVDDIIDKVKDIIRPVATFSGKTGCDTEPVLAAEMLNGMSYSSRHYGILPVVLSVPVGSDVAFVFATADVPQDVAVNYVQRELDEF